MVLDTSVRRQSLYRGLEVCCRPIRITYGHCGRRGVSFDAAVSGLEGPARRAGLEGITSTNRRSGLPRPTYSLATR